MYRKDKSAVSSYNMTKGELQAWFGWSATTLPKYQRSTFSLLMSDETRSEREGPAPDFHQTALAVKELPYCHARTGHQCEFHNNLLSLSGAGDERSSRGGESSGDR
jgi:hypothetical protein